MSGSHFPARFVRDSPDRAVRGRGQECFADEVAIDFPSVTDVVERMCDDFFGDDEAADPHQAELRVSPREAVDGLVAPLQVPVRHVCRACGGRGETWTEACVGCCGTGVSLRHHSVHVMLPSGVRDGARYRFRLLTPSALPTCVELTVAVR